MELDFRHLRLIKAIVDTGSLTAAAAVVGMAQPSATAALVRAERILGGKLFHRATSGAVPTQLGELVAAHALTVLGALEQLAEFAGARDGEDAVPGTLRVGATPGLLASALPRIIDQVLDATPDVRIGLNGRRWVNLLASRQLDAALVTDYPGDEVVGEHAERRVVAVEPIFVGLPAGHPLAGRAEVELADLAGDTFGAVRDTGPSIREHLIGACRTAGFAPERASLGFADVRAIAQRPHTVLLMKPSSQPPPGMFVVPLAGTPLRMTTSLHIPAEQPAGGDGTARKLWAELVEAQHGIVEANDTYRAWLKRHPEWSGALPASGRSDAIRSI
ncbi:hypothetical protein GCM10010123_05540 [Pilimelia anulata]|uniref:HTH lysR-type domain-containing protein n=1 Tax=Pilimelia anulata TaxID=53371 RepID=A0A8J3AZH4_9ACTN|nr:LysR family transcriptional regulator [Pilimelia anulata]GGJ78459.1 hypothetical protein GCM10010123_05540 [Pilimelia anulata]